jgi:hypothetical protein
MSNGVSSVDMEPSTDVRLDSLSGEYEQVSASEEEVVDLVSVEEEEDVDMAGVPKAPWKEDS